MPVSQVIGNGFHLFQSSAAGTSGCNVELRKAKRALKLFQSSAAGTSGCNVAKQAGQDQAVPVSILSRRDERLQHAVNFAVAQQDDWFQSSAAGTSGCNASCIRSRGTRARFQSSAAGT